MTCAHCGTEVPDGPFCTSCGASQERDRRGERRWHSYAAHPGEHVARINVLSSLFPQLEHRRVHDFRWALVTGVVALTGLYLLGLIVAAVLVATVLVPFLYLLYVTEAEVYGATPVRALAISALGGAVLGLAAALILDQVIAVRSLLPVTATGSLLLLTVAVPAVEEALKALPPLVLRRGRGLRHPLDGLSLGVAAGLGFALAQNAVHLSDVIANLPFRVDPAAWIYTLIGSALLLPLLQATCTGALIAAVSHPGPGGRRAGIAAGVAAVVGGHVAFSLGGRLLLEHGPGQVAVLVWQGLVVAAIVLYLRVLLHRALLQEGAEHGVAEIVCSHCGRRVLAGRFCPACGLALVASPLRSDLAVGAGDGSGSP